ncbi:MAG: hypothetical protein AAF961_15180, partial [Planctomycetota bacterium]
MKLTVFALLALFSPNQGAVGQILRWEITAGQVVYVSDPEGALGDVRLGDQFRGSFFLDLQMPLDLSPLDEEDLEFGVMYRGDLNMAGASFRVPNARSGDDFEFDAWEANPDSEYGAGVVTEIDFELFNAPFDWFFLFYPFEVVAVATGPSPASVETALIFGFIGPNVLTDWSLPTEINLEDWPLATAQLRVGDALVDAEIYGLRPLDPID